MTSEKQRRQYGTGSIHPAHKPGCPRHAHRDVAGCAERYGCRMRGVLDAGYTKTNKRRRVTVTGKTEADVKRRLRDQLRALEAGEQASSRMTVKAWSDTWLPLVEKRNRPDSYIADRSAVRQWIVPTIGHIRLSDLVPADIRAVDDAISSKRSTTTAVRYRSTLMQLLKAAAEEGHSVPERVLRVKPPAIAPTDRDAMPTEDALKILAVAATLPHGSTWAAAFLQGLRPAERRGLTWPEIFDDVFVVSWQLKALPYNVPRDRSSGFRVPDGYERRQISDALHLVRPKSKAGLRTYPLVPWMADALTHWRAIAPQVERGPAGIVWPMAANDKADAAEWRWLQDVAEVRHPSGRYYHRHEARHTTASLLLELEVPEPVIIQIMGHSTYASTRAYTHVRNPQVRDALLRVAGRLQLTPPAGSRQDAP